MKIKLLLLICITFSVSLLFSQNKTGIGNVSDITGILVPNAVVNISPSSNSSIVYEYICDKNGNYLFDIPSSESEFVVSILPSEQTLQFANTDEIIELSDGNNGILYHYVTLFETNNIHFTVIDNSGNPVSNAKITLYDTKRKWRLDSCRTAKPIYTDVNGEAEISSLLPNEYWFNVKKDYLSNRFTTYNIVNDIPLLTSVTVTIRDLTQNEFYMCGLCDNKTWITDSIVTFGISTPYDADSKLMSDGTWYDSNDNHGFWWFNSTETSMTYDYDSNSANGGGSTVDADLITLTDNYFSGDMSMLGLPVTYYMSALYDSVNLSLLAPDTTIYLNSLGTTEITSDDMFLQYDYCFNCNLTISQTSFDNSDIGDVEIYVTLEDRCGNTVTDTMTLTVVEEIIGSVNEIGVIDIRIFPNPANDIVTIRSKNKIIKRIDVLAVSGTSIMQQDVDKKQFNVDVSGLKKGVFLIKIYTLNDIIVEKLIIR